MLGFKKVDRKPFQMFVLKLESMTDRTRLHDTTEKYKQNERHSDK